MYILALFFIFRKYLSLHGFLNNTYLNVLCQKKKLNGLPTITKTLLECYNWLQNKQFLINHQYNYAKITLEFLATHIKHFR